MNGKHLLFTLLLLFASAATLYGQFPCVSGITVNGPGGQSDIDLCQSGSSSILNFSSNINALPVAYLVVDENDIIVYIGTRGSIDFSTLPGSNFRVFAFNFIGSIRAEAGDPLTTTLANGCFALSSNSIAVTGDAPSAGMVSTEDGATEAFTCPGDGLADLVQFDSSGVSAGASFTYLVTDENNVITEIITGDIADFEDDSIGVSRVWGLAYNGTLTAMVGDDATAASLADGCFSLSSNFVTIIRDEPEGGMVSTEDGLDMVSVCVGDGVSDTLRFDSMGVGTGNFTYVVTDTNNVILAVPAGDAIDFDASGPGVCRVWGLSYTGMLTASVGDTASIVSLADGCFALSDNFVTVNREEVNGGDIATDTGDIEIFTCPDSTALDTLRFVGSGTLGDNFAFVLTDTNNIILSFPDTNFLLADTLSEGIYRLWGLAYSGTLNAMIGDDAATTTLSNGCFALSNNFLTIFNAAADGGMISTEDGETEVFTCPGDGNADVIRFDSSGVIADSFAYVITDTNNVILSVPDADFADFEGAGQGICRVWGLGYSGTLLAMAGDTASSVLLSDGCFGLSSNFITVNRESLDGGMVMAEGGETEVFLCPGNGISDTIRFDSAGVGGGQFAYVVTDSNNVILGLPAGDFVDFDGSGIGVCRVWGLVYVDSLTAMVGDTASTTTLAAGCYALSNNFVTVTRQQPEGGMVMTDEGETVAYTCPGDSLADIVTFDHTGALGDGFTYIVTDTNNVILNVLSGDFADFDGAGLGACRVWGVAYTGNFTGMPGDDAAAVALSDDCYSLSSSFVTVYRDIPEGGSVSTVSGDTIVNTCTGDGIADLIVFDNMGASNSAYAYVVTDTNAVILNVSNSDTIDFENAGGGICYVWGLAYTGAIIAMPGDTASAISLSDDCFDLSDNFVEVIREEIGGGMVSTEDGLTEVYLCPGDGLADTIRFDSSATLGELFTYIVTDTNNVIIGLPSGDFVDFDGSGIGVCRVWGLVYSDSLTAMLGDTASVASLATGCYALSNNFITIFRDVPDGGTLSTVDGLGQITTCSSATLADEILFDSMGVVNSLFAYIVTDTSNIILYPPNTDLSGFSSVGLELIRVWGMAYTGNITATVGDTLSIVALSDECYDLTDNFIPVNQEEAEGGDIQAEGGAQVVYTCPGDGVADVVGFENLGGFGLSYGYLLTDTNNVLLGINESSLFNFDGIGMGVFRVWGLGYSGTFTAVEGDTLGRVDITDGCFDLSDNYVTINIAVPNGGMVSTESGDTQVAVIVGDGLSDVVSFDSTDVSNSPFTYLITDTNSVVLAIPTGDEANFENSGPGVCLVWGLAYTGALNFAEGDTLASLVNLSTDCSSLSSNFITVTRQQQNLMRPQLERPAVAERKPLPFEMKAWPTPVNHELMVNIDLNEDSQNGILRLMDFSGKKVLEQAVRLEKGPNQVALNTEGLLPGMYLLQLQATSGQASLMLIKQ